MKPILDATRNGLLALTLASLALSGESAMGVEAADTAVAIIRAGNLPTATPAVCSHLLRQTFATTTLSADRLLS